MICYLDKTFCSSDCTMSSCSRHFSIDDAKDADAWWGGPGAPIARCDFSVNCTFYTPPDEKTRAGSMLNRPRELPPSTPELGG